MIKNYLKTALRNFGRNKLFIFINIIGLSIGISAALVIYLIVHYDFTFDKFHKDGDRIYRVVTNFTFEGQPAYNSGVSGPIPGAVKTKVTGVDVSAPLFILYQTDTYVPGSKGRVKFKAQNDIIVTDRGYFNIFQYTWLAGSAKTALNDPNQVVLTSARAKKYFPGLTYDQMIGRIVIYDAIKTTVTGVVQTIKENTDFTFSDFISFATTGTNKDLKSRLSLLNWGGTSPERQLFVKLSPQIQATNIERQLNDILKENEVRRPENKGSTHTLHLQPLNDIHFNANYGTFNGHVANKTTLYELFAIAVFILLLGCINFVNLTTAQGARRAKEIGIRKTMGSSRKQLVAQFLSETFLITLIAVLISAAMAPVILKFFSGFVPADIKADIFNQPAVLLFLLFLLISVSLLSGFYPALVLSGYKPVSVLKNQDLSSDNKTRNAWLRKSLTVTQFVIAQFFIMAIVLVSKQIYYAVHKDLGFKKDAIIILNSPWKNRTASLNQIFINKLRAIPQVDLVSAGRDAPTSDDWHSTQATYRAGKKEIKMELGLKFGDENYIRVYKIKLLAGRDLEPGDTSKAFLINNTYARIIGFQDPHDAVGKQIDDFNGDKPMRIAGVVSDFQQESLHAPIAPLAILTSTNLYFNGTFHIALKPQTTGSDDWKQAIASMQKIYKEIYPDDDFDYRFFDESIARLYENEQHTSTLLSWATGLSIFISCLGLLGLAMYTTNLRTKEIGVRKVLGASVSQIVKLLSAELVSLVILAFVLVTPVAWWAMNKWMQNFADRTTISWWVFALSGIGMLLTAFLTLSFQTIKAAIANPVKSLRSE
ncbi:MAG: FtsX-like permease family protein [Mucilaginibacter sp.]|nr:FtsX-like permease family protein [Mucilaginibacter sp.]